MKLALMNYRENLIRAYRFQRPQWIPISSGFPPMLWKQYDAAALDEMMVNHKILFPNYEKGSIDPETIEIPPDLIAGQPYTDGWGCVWETAYTGMVGSVSQHALASWDNFDSFQPPDPDRHDGMRPIDWEKLRRDAVEARKAGFPVGLGLPHGHTFLRIQDLRGYENLMYDMMDEDPRLDRLIEMVTDFNLALIKRYITLAPDLIMIPEDLGMQSAPMISPKLFRRYIKPAYQAMMSTIKQQEIIIHEHSDGYIMDLIDDIIEAGSEVINLQDLVNGIDNLAQYVKGRIAIDLDIDRQEITVNGSPQDIDDMIREAVTKLGSESGGLSMCYQPWPPTPLENIRAVLDAMEKYCTMYN